jgi:hypothetical protein
MRASVFPSSLVALIAVLTACSGPSGSKAEERKAKHASDTEAAWTALEAKDFEEARRRAAECIDDFFPRAVDLEKKLREAKAVLAKDKVTETEKREIHENGPLNDVATCWYILGRAYDHLGSPDKAKGPSKRHRDTRTRGVMTTRLARSGLLPTRRRAG